MKSTVKKVKFSAKQKKAKLSANNGLERELSKLLEEQGRSFVVMSATKPVPKKAFKKS